ncbi:uncharacterized protein G2W53_032663 [Senna tora]|uniref:Uncharacterized protein n=1 Tax=Senna tora TaxID=362788 RepID=A0A834W759_9FABA|nr:uncharacterized protein G2W53_032663 [Senna tora]
MLQAQQQLLMSRDVPSVGDSGILSMPLSLGDGEFDRLGTDLRIRNLKGYTLRKVTPQIDLCSSMEVTTLIWKARMKIFIQANDYPLWDVIMNGPKV